MKNLAKLLLFFSLSFTIIFLAATGIRFLTLWVEWVRYLPPKPESSLTLLITAAHWALSLTMYFTILLNLSYAARKNYSIPVTMISVIIVSLFLNFGISFLLYNWKHVPPAEVTGRQMGESGLILSSSLNKNEAAVILLKGTAEPLGPRVTSIPDRPLMFHESTANVNISLPPIPFGDDTPWLLQSAIIDLRLNAEQLQQRFNESFLSYFIYVGALIFMLSSLGFIIKLSVWPLANLFLGILAFRGVLALETFLNSPEMRDVFGSLPGNIMSNVMAVPIIFFFFALLVNTYSILVFIAKRRDDNEF